MAVLTQVLSSAGCLYSWWAAADTSTIFKGLSVQLVCSCRHKYCLRQAVSIAGGQLQTQVLSSPGCLQSWWAAADTSTVFSRLSVMLVCNWTLRMIKLRNYVLLQLHMPPTLTLKTVYWHKSLFIFPMIYGIKLIPFLSIIHRIAFMTDPIRLLSCRTEMYTYLFLD